jgi:MmyB-like transcription regulator ligand binding domain
MLMFTSREVRERYPNWESDARAMLESFRVAYDFWAHSSEFVALKDELCLRNREFRMWWKARLDETKRLQAERRSVRSESLEELEGHDGYEGQQLAI